MKRYMLALSALALLASSTAHAGAVLYEDKGTVVAEQEPDHGFMPGVVHERRSFSLGSAQTGPDEIFIITDDGIEIFAPRIPFTLEPLCERVDCTLLWGCRVGIPDEDGFIWWGEVLPRSKP